MSAHAVPASLAYWSEPESPSTLNLFLGLTGFGWVIALVWAVYREPTGPGR